MIVSNGVVNLTPDKHDTFRELRWVLRPGGRLLVADVVVDRPVPDDARARLELWTECVAGATPVEAYVDLVRGAGFGDVEITGLRDVFAGTRIAGRARRFGARSALVRAGG